MVAEGAAGPKTGNRARRYLNAIAGTLVAMLITFFLAATAGSLIPRNADWREPRPGVEATVPILIGTNGIHTEIVMPNQTPYNDWLADFSLSDLALSDLDSVEDTFTHVSVSWGERTFFLETPTWADANPLTAIGALAGGDAIFHVAHYAQPIPSDDYRMLHLRPAKYRALADAIAAQLPPEHRATIMAGYGRYDVFYDALGTYHLGQTCNQWTADQLAGAGVKSGWWTPLPGGVMRWVPLPSDN